MKGITEEYWIDKVYEYIGYLGYLELHRDKNNIPWSQKINEKGKTVAHIFAELNMLPGGFNQWDIADDEGWTIKQEAVLIGNQKIKNDAIANDEIFEIF